MDICINLVPYRPVSDSA